MYVYIIQLNMCMACKKTNGLILNHINQFTSEIWRNVLNMGHHFAYGLNFDYKTNAPSSLYTIILYLYSDFVKIEHKPFH
jgi:hypothetical protein